ncbi:hypothetical protein LCGC14_1519600 [marine sediment metagenome]|uniref:Uncharacterized protein n=1 Tax=marine sediment metagenome TaxID=412755 RepID=A0A0F9IZ14_9ZZZZ
MVRGEHVVYVSYAEAQGLIPIFEYYVKEGPWKEVRSDAAAILAELRMVRDISYEFLGGYQMFLTEEQLNFFEDVRNEVGR